MVGSLFYAQAEAKLTAMSRKRAVRWRRKSFGTKLHRSNAQAEAKAYGVFYSILHAGFFLSIIKQKGATGFWKDLSEL